MKLILKIVLILYITSLVTPIIVSYIEKNKDTSCLNQEDEEQSTNKDFKVEFLFEPKYDLLLFTNPTSQLIVSAILSKDNLITSKVIGPPPDCI